MSKKMICILIVTCFLSMFGCSGGGSDGGVDPPNNNLPPDPGDAGKATLQGIDSDNDGVRDDVQIAIDERYPNDINSQRVLTQQAVSLQDAIMVGDSGDQNNMAQVAEQIKRATNCLTSTMPDPADDAGFMETQVVNTKARSDAYMKFNAAMNGQFFGVDTSSNPCN